MTKTHWRIASPPPPDRIDHLRHLPPVIQAVLWQRGLVTEAEMKEFIQPDYERLGDPFAFRQMRPAVDRIIRAIEKKERIMIYGDYDADGVTSTAIIYEGLRMFGADIHWYLPERLTEGYGLNIKAMDSFVVAGTKLLITVDCGTSNYEEITHIKKNGIDTIVLDHHHQPAELPPALAIINPVFTEETYPDRRLSSAGVSFALIRAMIRSTDNGRQLGSTLSSGWEKWFLDLVAISTVADMMPLRGENRILVRYGLMVLRKTKRPGLQALFAVMGMTMPQADEYAIGFMIAPRLNAAGRLHHASLALRLLLTTDISEAKQLAAQLQDINQDRQRLTELAVGEALEQVDEARDQAAIAAFAPHWSPGILGLIAGRLAERLYRPVVVMTENGGTVVGSGRSIPGVDMMKVMDDGRKYFSRYGGHPGACGFTLLSVDGRSSFAAWFQERMSTAWEPGEATKILEIDARARLDDFHHDVLDLLETLGPYGMEHRRPLFVIEKTTVADASTVGIEGKHLRLQLRDRGADQRAIGFRLGTRLSEFPVGSLVDVVVEVAWNEWQGRREPQLKIIDLRSAHE